MRVGLRHGRDLRKGTWKGLEGGHGTLGGGDQLKTVKKWTGLEGELNSFTKIFKKKRVEKTLDDSLRFHPPNSTPCTCLHMYVAYRYSYRRNRTKSPPTKMRLCNLRGQAWCVASPPCFSLCLTIVSLSCVPPFRVTFHPSPNK